MSQQDEPVLTMETFERDWVSAHDAIDLLAPTLRRDLAAKHLVSRVRAGLFRAVAHTCIQVERSEETGRQILTAVHPVFFSEDTLGADSSFWILGDFTHWGSGAYLTNGLHLKFFGVRFDPEGLRSMLPTNRVFRVAPVEMKEEAEDASTKSPVSDAALARWSELFLTTYPDAPFATAWQSAKGMFPRHHVARSRVEAAIPSKPMGRPKTSHKTES